MAEPVIQYNASTGSDTLASGAGPATAIGGSPNVATVVSGPSTIIELTTGSPFTVVDVSGVATDGSHAIWMDTPSGRKFSKIVGRVLGDAGKGVQARVTVEDTFSFAGGVNFAIGGKRQTLESDASQLDYSDFKEGWTVEFDSGTYDLDNTWTVPISTVNGPGFTIRAASGFTTKPLIRRTSTTATTEMIQLGHRTRITDIRFENDSTANNSGNNILRNNNFLIGVIAERCEFICDRTSSSNGGWGFRGSNSIGLSGIFLDCRFEGGIYGIQFATGRCNVSLVNCHFENNFYHVRSSSAGNNGSLFVDHCTFANSASLALWIGSQNSWSNHIRNCTFYNNGNNAIHWDGNNQRFVEITHCIFVNNSGWALNNAGSGAAYQYENYNFFWNNTSGNISTTDVISGGLSQSVNPLLTDPANDDFSLQSTSPAIEVGPGTRYAGSITPTSSGGGGTPQSVGYAFG